MKMMVRREEFNELKEEVSTLRLVVKEHSRSINDLTVRVEALEQANRPCC